METQDRPQAETFGAEAAETWKPPRWLKVLALVAWSVSFVIHLLRGRWVTAAFFVATVFLFLRGRDIDRWPKPRRYLAIAVYAALAVAMLVELLWQLKVLF